MMSVHSNLIWLRSILLMQPEILYLFHGTWLMVSFGITSRWETMSVIV
jgi:hypothetical protein